jgi:membrane protein DedA with SNARE-associated domain
MDIDFRGLVDSYGYLAVLVGAFLEGETILALAGLAAYRGYLDFYTVVAIALVAGFAGDQFFFFLGRYQGARILARFPSLHGRALQIDAMLARWHAPLIVAIRFMYGLRIAGPILLGMGRVSSMKFVVFNFIGAAIWAPLVAGIGYFFGSLIGVVLGDMQQLELWLLAAVIAACAIAIYVRHLRSRRA